LIRAKYPLAIISKALATLGDRLLAGSDIGCALSATIASSSLGERFQSLGWRCCVNAFHGYAHNFACQLKNHPNNVEGVGLEDLETLERVFSSSNAVASVTRHATAYRRRVFIDMFFKQWDEEKYQNSGVMLYNNYVQALDILAVNSQAVSEAMDSMDIKEGDLEKWRVEEAEYFQTLGKEPEWDAHAVAYVGLLQELRVIE
jgi:hypothetical protein